MWSVIVTIFGDLALDASDQISGAMLSRLTQMMGIKPQAMRVALHRLRKDGWLISERKGRTSMYQLTPRAYSESQAVRGRIYALHPPNDWQLVLKAHGDGDTRTAIKVASGVFLRGGEAPIENRDNLILSGGAQHVPNWLKDIASTPELHAKYAKLDAILTQTEAMIDTWPDPFEIATLRVLIVHNWRRIVLRHPDLPAQFYAEVWPGIACRKRVSTLLTRLARPDFARV